MEIYAIDGRFMIGMMLRDIEYKSNADGSLSVWGGKKSSHVSVTTNRGTFIEAVDKADQIVVSGGDGNWLYIPISKEPVRLRFKKLPTPTLTAAEIEKARKTMTVTVANQEQYDNGPFNFGAAYTDGTLTVVMGSLEKISNSIPKEHRAKAQCKIDSKSGYEGSHYAHIKVSYARPETDREVIARLQIEAERKRLSEDAERAQFRKLKSKFCAA